MTLTYIFHSGFALEADRCIVVFDYWRDPAGVMTGKLQSEKPLYVLSSHFHEDHFTREIFGWRALRPDTKYVLSKDILRHRRAQRSEADVWMAKGASWTDGRIKVRALGSTDAGVSWIVETEGKRIFHAGDLNNWYARFLPNAVAGQTIHSDEMDEDVDPVAHEKRYLGELKDIRKAVTELASVASATRLMPGVEATGGHLASAKDQTSAKHSTNNGMDFDIAMFPVDGRIGNGYTLGGRQFMERFSVGLFVPMHFVASGPESAWRIKEFTDERSVALWRIGHSGESIDF